MTASLLLGKKTGPKACDTAGVFEHVGSNRGSWPEVSPGPWGAGVLGRPPLYTDKTGPLGGHASTPGWPVRSGQASGANRHGGPRRQGGLGL